MTSELFDVMDGYTASYGVSDGKAIRPVGPPVGTLPVTGQRTDDRRAAKISVKDGAYENDRRWRSVTPTQTRVERHHDHDGRPVRWWPRATELPVYAERRSHGGRGGRSRRR